MIHVLALPLPAQGHISPAMHLSKLLASQSGITVSFVNVDSLHKEMMKHWTAEDEHHSDLRFHEIPFSWEMPTGVDVSVIAQIHHWYDQLEQQLSPALSRLITRISTEIGPVRCIISDYSLPWTQDVADSFNIPRIVLWSGSAAWTSLEYHIPQLLEKGHIHPLQGERVPLDEAKSIVVDYVRGVSPIVLADLPEYMLLDDNHEEARKFSMRRHASVKRAAWVLVNSFYELEKDTFDFMSGEIGSRFVAAGPMFLLDPQADESGPANVVLRPESRDCLRWLDEQQHSSVLYISFGSIWVVDEEQFRELATAIHESGTPFLWVIRSEQESLCDKLVDETVRKRGKIVSWAPQLSVLAHPAVGCFLTHCGWNSTLESICNGVPMICWPHATEQNTNSKLIVEHWRIGVRFNAGVVKELIGRSHILSAIRTVMGDKEMKLRAENMKGSGRKAVGKNGAGHSYNNFTAFVKYLTT